VNGHRLLITGGTRGIGRATALAAARAGAKVVVCSRQHGPEAVSLVEALAELGSDHAVVQADITQPQAAADLIDRCRERLGGLDALVNNVGVDGRAALADLTAEQWHRVMDANLTGTFLVTQAALKLLADGGSIINVGSSAAVRGRPLSSHYAASKSALTGFTRSLAKELGSRGIRVNTVAPGVIVTEPEGAPPPEVAELIKAVTALGRLGSPADVVGAVLFLAGPDSQYISGSTIYVDGGI
jgi:3-oxoacyl-[acyl-carrier protein] reductase